jgi:hypothetical protein
LKILTICPSYIPVTGGAEASIHETLRLLSLKGYKCTVITLIDPFLIKFFPDRVNNEVLNDIQIIKLKPKDFYQKIQSFIINTDIIFCQMFRRFEELGIFNLQEYLLDKKIKWVYFQRANPKYETFKAPYIVSNSNYSASIYYSLNYDKKNLFVLNPPIREFVKKSYKRDFITIINPTIKKGGDCFRYLAKEFPEQKFLAQLSWGIPAKYIDKLDNVMIMNPTDDMSDIYYMTSILLVPSLSEPLGRVAVEGALTGCLVIANYLDGLKEIPLPDECFIKEITLESWKDRLNWFLNMNEIDKNKLFEDISKRILFYKSDIQGLINFISNV